METSKLYLLLEKMIEQGQYRNQVSELERLLTMHEKQNFISSMERQSLLGLAKYLYSNDPDNGGQSG